MDGECKLHLVLPNIRGAVGLAFVVLAFCHHKPTGIDRGFLSFCSFLVDQIYDLRLFFSFSEDF
jgi:hypothetical protein